MTFQVKPGQQRLLTTSTVIQQPSTSGTDGPARGLFGKTSVITNGEESDATKSSLGSKARSEERASRSLSILANSLTLKEDAVQKRGSTLSQLQELASKIKNESDPVKAATLREDAAALVEAQNESDSQAAADDDTVGELVSATIRTQPFDDLSSEGVVSVSLAATSSLADLGVTAASFTSGDIDATIETLTTAQETNAIEADSLAASRAGLQAAVNEAGTKAESAARASGVESPERFASRIASTISRASSNMIDSGISALPVESLLSNPDLESGATDSNSG